MSKNKKEKLKKLLGWEKEKLIKLENFKKGQGSRIEDFKKVYDKIKEIDSISDDRYVPIKNLETVIKNEKNISLKDDKEGDSFLFSDWSLSQLCVRYKVPKRYIKHCLYKDSPELAAKNLNYWLKKENDDTKVLLRYDKFRKRLHGFLTERYGIFDDIEVFDIMDTSFSSDDYRVQSFFVSPEFTNIRIIQDKKFYDDLSIGFNIRNSRVGRSSLYFEVLVYKWICSNGLILGGGKATAYRRRHIDIEKNKVIREVKELTADLPEIIENLKFKIEAAENNTLDDETLESMLDNLKNKQKVSEKAISLAKEKLLDYGQTQWGLINGITEIAQNYNLDTRYSLEKYAANLLRGTA
ncbi:MAG: DUF932 domain-containing protein [bacterium]